MKTLYYSFLFWLSISTVPTMVAQEHTEAPAKILKVSYSTSNVSDFLVKMLKSKIKDPQKYAEVMNKISSSRVYHSLYQNIQTKESIYVLDSIHKVPGVHNTGHCTYAFKDDNNVIHGAELFMGKEVNFKGDTEVLEWHITNETTQINGVSCIKAELQTNPEVYVWFTLEIPVEAGPYMYTNLPGLVLESNGFFQSTTITQLAYEKDTIRFDTLRKNAQEEMKSRSHLSLKKVLIKKQNFRRIAEKGKS